MKALAATVLQCCNLSVSATLNERFTTNGMCEKNNTYIYVAQTSNNRVISSSVLYCCLLPQCDALPTCRLGFPAATVKQLTVDREDFERGSFASECMPPIPS